MRVAKKIFFKENILKQKKANEFNKNGPWKFLFPKYKQAWITLYKSFWPAFDFLLLFK